MTKKSLRKHHRGLRDQMSNHRVLKLSRPIVADVMALKAVQEADCVFSYNAFGSEVILDPVLLTGWQVALPQVKSKEEMVFRLITPDTIYETSAYGVKEPSVGTITVPTDKSVILVPGSVFDSQGRRIGYGGGYYDRYMAANPGALKIGICYDHQITDLIPAEDHDIAMDMIVTDKRIIDCR